MNTQEIFHDFYSGSKNFMTPEVIEYVRFYVDGTLHYAEISEGAGIARNAIYGLTVLKESDNGVVRASDLSDLFFDLKALWEHLKDSADNRYPFEYSFNNHPLFGN
jgi:hypothetical protein